MKKYSCINCIFADIKPTEIRCTHWHHPGRTMSRDLRFDKSSLRPVTGMEWVKHCPNFKRR